MYYMELIEDDSHEQLLDVLYFCSASCYTEKTGKPAIERQIMIYQPETDYDVYCASCDSLLWRGLNSEDDVD